jgi:hypothetical protein
MEERTNCAICESTEFDKINNFLNFPITSACNGGNNDLFYNYYITLCKKCCCLQLKYLVDPSILYSSSYMISTFSPAWLAHNTHFTEFILQNTNNTSFLEIGANKGGLYNIISSRKNIDYTVLDMYREPDLPSDVRFLEGNCETFDFTGITTVILSHVFEHLFCPNKFVKGLCKAKVKDIFISNPDFDFLLESKYLNTVYSQHTYYCGFDHLIYLFSLNKYRCESFYKYKGTVKSLMFKFTYDPLVLPKALPYIDKSIFTDLYINRVKYIETLEIPKNIVICPSGIYGQYLYYFIKDKENILGFIDNDTQRQNNKLYGTGKTVFSPNDIDFTSTHVLLCDSYYNNEIIAGLKALCPSVQITIV